MEGMNNLGEELRICVTGVTRKITEPSDYWSVLNARTDVHESFLFTENLVYSWEYCDHCGFLTKLPEFNETIKIAVR